MIGKLSTLIDRLHSSRSGYASFEFIMAAPTMLLFLVLIFETGKFQAAKVDALYLTKMAAWTKASGGFCFYKENIQVMVREAMTLPPVICEQGGDGADSSSFWSDLDRAGGENLTGTTSDARTVDKIDAHSVVAYKFHNWTGIGTKLIESEYHVLMRENWTHEDPAMTVGYDRELKGKFAGIGSFPALIPNVFPGAE